MYLGGGSSICNFWFSVNEFSEILGKYRPFYKTYSKACTNALKSIKESELNTEVSTFAKGIVISRILML